MKKSNPRLAQWTLTPPVRNTLKLTAPLVTVMSLLYQQFDHHFYMVLREKYPLHNS